MSMSEVQKCSVSQVGGMEDHIYINKFDPSYKLRVFHGT